MCPVIDDLRRAIKTRAPRLAAWLTRTFPTLRGRQRILAAQPESVRETWSARRVNRLSTGLTGVRSYLEVGVQGGLTLEGVKIAERVAVDPYPLFDLNQLPIGVQVHVQTSDEYFSDLPVGDRFDVVFLDGLHEWFQTYRDIINAMNHLAPGGVILVDDVIPCDEVSALPSLQESYRIREETGSPERRWHGDVYKALFAVRDHHKDAIAFRVILDLEGNSQAVMWRGHADSTGQLALTARADDYHELTYARAFPDGQSPSFFVTGSEDDVLQQVILSVATQRSADGDVGRSSV